MRDVHVPRGHVEDGSVYTQRESYAKPAASALNQSLIQRRESLDRGIAVGLPVVVSGESERRGFANFSKASRKVSLHLFVLLLFADVM